MRPTTSCPGTRGRVQTRVDAGDRGRIGVTDPTCFDPNPNLAGTRFGYGALDNAKTAWR